MAELGAGVWTHGQKLNPAELMSWHFSIVFEEFLLKTLQIESLELMSWHFPVVYEDPSDWAPWMQQQAVVLPCLQKFVHSSHFTAIGQEV